MALTSLNSPEILWGLIAFVALIVILAILRFVLKLALGLIRTILIVGSIFIIFYLLYAYFLR
jgi:hypothetical protein